MLSFNAAASIFLTALVLSYLLAAMAYGFGFSHRKVGGLRFIRIGRLQLSYCICRQR
ncbi:hypothetical protein [Bradyrhizobium sp. SZCCHNRI2049]|uniref:hypothetical protein n=1 Tax=Bradyrhizobium sp. SZCCHNRI2049 TaxID=3057287 RepID=UPI002916B54F|nr:hypothetical protein [Bradyrhizobium sp. SZCCHNRI2049]